MKDEIMKKWNIIEMVSSLNDNSRRKNEELGPL
jgi:hypothetical protein